MQMLTRLRAWSYTRQRIGDPAPSLQRALRAVVAVYSTHPTAPLALWARTRSFSADRYRRLDRDRTAVRIPAMRRTVFLVPREDAARIFAAVRASPAHARRGVKRHGISDARYERISRR